MSKVTDINDSVNKKSSSGSLVDSINGLDSFGQNFNMKIKEDSNSFDSWMGLFLSVILVVIMGTFIYTKGVAWKEKKDVDVMSALYEHAITYDYQFNSDQGLFIAAGISEYDSNTEIIEEPEVYGELIIEHYGWGYDD